jgi:hypothetical protein
MEWLEAKLHNARTSRIQLILVMHIPPGIDAFASSLEGYRKPATLFWRDDYLDAFRALMRNYGDLVKSPSPVIHIWMSSASSPLLM